MHNQLKLADNPASDVDATSPTSEQQPSEPSNNSTSTSSPSPTQSIESTLPGVKLQKTSTQWSEANAYFQLQQHTLPSYHDIDAFAYTFQKMIYDYFALNYGTIKPQTINNNNKSSNKSIKKLKNKLKQLKLLGRNNQGFDNLIRSTSKELRAKLLSTKISKSGKSCGNITSQLKRRFWWTCKRIFAQTENLKPLFNKKCQLPNWTQQLQRPSTLCNTSPPSYHEISTIVRKNALETPEKSDKNLELSPPPQREQAFPERLDSNIMETPLIGIKIPKTLKHWTEANTYFQLHRTSLPNVSDINNFTTSFQSLIYNYFASNYGTVKQQKLSTTQHPNKTVKNMKKDLKQLKLLGRNDHSFDMKISTISKQIRTELLSMKNAKTEKHVDITKQLKVKFWSTCKKLFNPSNSLTPSFSIDDCKKYFYNILHDPFHNKFHLPNWVPTLQQPTIPCNIDPPTYHEIATVIRKCKLRASPCLYNSFNLSQTKINWRDDFRSSLINSAIASTYAIYCHRNKA
ncbi:hypothetical protein HELRODRAFT_176152 [Helobdella robusta]|uniref:Uncharacterized protein n=1 Tax=Helobdella robusta TaxID=6412 RepID=T1FA77_HELRO|nr:hypothetical protein HELRODRAFT_176152 [Helobdella robusta]ESO00288.1 hypothetical protein HELRODRAFT_176152 [Helobdella robusta]